MYTFEHYKGSLGEFDYNTHDFVVTSMKFIAKASCAVAKACEEDESIDDRNLMLRFLRLQKIDSRIKLTEDDVAPYISDDNMEYDKDCLCYVGNFEKTIRLPEGCIDVRGMFTSRIIPSDIKLEGFDRGNIISTAHMFEDADLSNIRNFNKLRINTVKVRDMRAMFGNCILPSDFDLGSNFITIRVTNMYAMFRSATFAGYIDISLDTRNVKTMREMFANVETKELESLTLSMNTSGVEDMAGMFFGVNARNSKHMILDLGENFSTESAVEIYSMFESAKLHDNFVFGKKFVFDAVEDGTYMFANAILPENIVFSESMIQSACFQDESMFEGAVYPNGRPFDIDKAIISSKNAPVKSKSSLTMSDIFGF